MKTYKAVYDKKFLMRYYSTIYNVGTIADPEDKAGLLATTVQAIDHVMLTYPTSQLRVLEMEKSGVLSGMSAARDYTVWGARFSREKSAEALRLEKDFLSEIEIDQQALEIAKRKLLVEIESEKNTPRRYAATQFINFVLGHTNPYGTKESLERIDLEDVGLWAKHLKPHMNVYITDDGSIQIEEMAKKIVANPNKKTDDITEPVKILPEDYEQKVLLCGYRMNEFASYDPLIVDIAHNLLSDYSLGGLYTQEIREKRSLAYYAFATARMFSQNGVFLLCAGVSEQNLPEAVKVTRDIVRQVRDGGFSHELLDNAKSSVKTNYESAKGSSQDLYSLYVNDIVYGRGLEAIDDRIARIDNIRKEDIVDFYDQLFAGQEKLLICGKISDSIRSKI